LWESDFQRERSDIVTSVFSFFGQTDPYEQIMDVKLYAYPFAKQQTLCTRNWRDRDSEDRDDTIVHFQPVIVVRYQDGGEMALLCDKLCKELEFIDVAYEFMGQSSRAANLDFVRDGQFFIRCTAAPQPHLGGVIIMDPMVVSLYLFCELYTRRVLLAPKLSTQTAVERLIRFASEDDKTSGHLDVEVEQGKSVLRTTVSFMAGVISKDMTTAMKDF
jgi:hypothetical protein